MCELSSHDGGSSMNRCVLRLTPSLRPPCMLHSRPWACMVRSYPLSIAICLAPAISRQAGPRTGVPSAAGHVCDELARGTSSVSIERLPFLAPPPWRSCSSGIKPGSPGCHLQHIAAFPAPSATLHDPHNLPTSSKCPSSSPRLAPRASCCGDASRMEVRSRLALSHILLC